MQYVPIILNGSSSLNLSKSQIIIQYINIINIAGNIKIITNINLYAMSNDSILNSINLTPTGSTKDSLMISFPIAFNANTPADTYTINVVPPGDNQFPSSFTASTTMYTINNLQSDTLHTIDISFINVYGNRVISNRLGYYTLIPPVRDLSGVISTDTTIDISFNVPSSGTVDYYEVTTDPLPISGSVPQRFDMPIATYTINNLLSDTSYNISVVAKNNSNNTSESVSTAYYTLLSPPTNVIGTGRTVSTIDISFNVPSGRVLNYLATATTGGSVTIPPSFTGTTTQFTGLESDTSYNISVVARNNNGDSAPSTAIEYYTLIPPITDLSGIISTDSTIDISFNAPTTGRVDYYEVTTEPPPIMGNIPQIFNAPLTTYTINNLLSDTSYNINVVARNNSNNTSVPVSTAYYTLLSPPTDVIGTGRTINTIDISFNPPSTGTVVDYLATAMPATGFDVSNVSLLTTTQITGLESDTSYNIYVIARNSNGNSGPSAVLEYYTLIPPVRDLKGGISTSTTIDISFNVPITGRVDYYEVITDPLPISGNSIQRFDMPIDTYTINNLQSNTLYNIFVVARNNINNGNNSSASVSIPYYTTLSPPTALIAPRSNSSTIDISFNPPSGTVVDYEVTADPSGGVIVKKVFNVIPYTIPDLSSNTLYRLSVVARNSNGNSSPSTTVSKSTTLSPPTIFPSTGQTANTITISFTPPTGTIISYRVYAQPIPSGTIVDQSFNAPRSTYTITSLTLGTQYTIYMTATNLLGTSGNSNSITATTALSTVTPTLNSGYNVYTFTSNGTIVIPTTTAKTIYYLVVGGGGGGGANNTSPGGGGGAGGLLQGSCTISSKNTITVTVGNGGGANSNGSNSSILFDVTTGNNKIAIGGGRGGNGGVSGAIGGSGGGGGVGAGAGGGTAGQGNQGANGASLYSGSGGGAGNQGDTYNSGIGVKCTQLGITNRYPNTYWAGGGGGTGGDGARGFARSGGGGGAKGGYNNNGSGTGGSGSLNPGSDGTTTIGGNGGANTGGGGGGGQISGGGGTGGSGIVIIAIQ
jgi:hypothetical protein